jgi:hypothetical protein
VCYSWDPGADPQHKYWEKIVLCFAKITGEIDTKIISKTMINVSIFEIRLSVNAYPTGVTLGKLLI